MAATTPRISVSGDVLRWARQQRGLTPEVAAKRLQISEAKLADFESGSSSPTIAQLRKMSEKYRRPLIVLLLDEPPTAFTPLRDFRSLPDADRDVYSPELSDAIKRATQQQEIYLELSEDLDRQVSAPALPADEGTIEEVATELRAGLGVTAALQRTWSDPKKALAEWRSRIESLGILVLETSDVSMKEMRGFSLRERLPQVVVLNGHDSERGKVFTLLHELAHLTLRQTGVCDLHQRSRSSDDVEIRCNAIAGETLLPVAELRQNQVVQSHPSNTEWSDDELGRIASIAGGASREAILRRLLQMGLASREEYEAYEEWRRARSRKSTGGPPPYRVQLRDRGRPFMRSVFEAYADGYVNLSEVVDLAGVRTKHLDTLQREAFK
jgi:Zn-dependent peptidase ImmA (M78 family)